MLRPSARSGLRPGSCTDRLPACRNITRACPADSSFLNQRQPQTHSFVIQAKKGSNLTGVDPVSGTASLPGPGPKAKDEMRDEVLTDTVSEFRLVLPRLQRFAKALFAGSKKALMEKHTGFGPNEEGGILPAKTPGNMATACAIFLITLPLAGCGSQLPAGPDYLAAVTQERKDCEAGKQNACKDYQARVAHCRDVQNRESNGVGNAPVLDQDPHACTGIDL
jgi:hypothetical protein